MKRTPLRRISKARRPEYQKYLKERDAWLHGRLCEFPEEHHAALATEVHHMRGRYGAMLRNTDWWLAVCREHHRWIHDNARKARLMNLIQ